MRPPTRGVFENIYNVEAGLTSCIANYSPMGKLSEDGPLTSSRMQQLPEVRHWSDVVTNLWKQQAGRRTGAMRYILRYDIGTEATKDVIHEAHSGWYKGWPGYLWPEGTEEFRTLLGTPHGRGVSNMLFQHPDEFGNKRVEGIHAFIEPRPNDLKDPIRYHLLFVLTH